MAVYTVSISDTSNFGDVNVGDGSTFASLSVSAGRGPKGDGFTGGSYNSSTGVVAFTSNEDLGFSTDDLRSFTGGSYNSTTGEVTFTSNTGVGFTTGDIRGGSIDETLGQIAASKADTAVDVFVYDTSKDSDGGAWRHRTQDTSWYNEPLNTSTRGARREFPAVAVIVAESDKVTIYDGDDPALPMWGNITYAMPWYSATLNSAVTAKNGVICATSSAGYGGLGIINFPAALNTWHGSGQGGDNPGIYVQENWDTTTLRPNLNTATRIGDEVLAARFVNDVAMTTLPGSPIDPATGLPVPTIAVATEGGVSVIKDDGTVVDSADTITVDYIGILGSNMWWGRAFSGEPLRRTPLIGIEDSFSYDSYLRDTAPAIFTNGTSSLATGSSYVAIASDQNTQGLFFADPYGNLSLGSICYVTSEFNTGWMPGDIKGAFLSDTDDTDLVGSGELVTNGTFDTDLSGWTENTSGVVTWDDSGAAKIGDGNGTVNTEFSQTISGLTPGAVYEVSFEITQISGAGVRIYFDGGNLGGGEYFTTSQVFYVVASSSSVDFYFYRFRNHTGEQLIDNVSFKLADADRSVNNNGLIVNGTVTREPVAPGADLVAYSGFSASNYLEQPYNPDLDFGTGDFCVMGWVVYKSSADGGLNFIIDRQDGANSSTNRLNVILTGSGLLNRCDSTSLTFNYTFVDSVRYFICLYRKNGIASAYVNGKLISSLTQTGDATATYPLVVGTSASFNADNNPKSLALIRISATAPTAEQIAKIYEDEKVLFQENAACTLYGTSDAVTALAHDPVTDLLHVGTSDGRSVFQGLRRVENTTDAVSTAISASNNLIVEQ